MNIKGVNALNRASFISTYKKYIKGSEKKGVNALNRASFISTLGVISNETNLLVCQCP